MEAPTKEPSWMGILMVMVNISGLMVVRTEETGKIILCMVQVLSFGPMEGITLVSIRTIKEMVPGYFIGLMDLSIRVSFKMGNNMEKEYILINKGKRETVFGTMENESKKYLTFDLKNIFIVKIRFVCDLFFQIYKFIFFV